MPAIAVATPSPNLLTAANHVLVLVDLQPQMAFATRNIDGVALRNNAGLVAEAAAGFGAPTVLTTVAEKTFSGSMFDEVMRPFPQARPIDRTTMNFWEDPAVIAAINATGRDRVVFAGLWTSVCIAGPALSALAQGFEVGVIADACGDISEEAHGRAMDRMMQRGAQPMTALQYLLELQRDWGRSATYGLTTGIAARMGGAYADDLAALIEALDLHDLVLVGHSTGGGEVARYIGRHGTARLSKAVLLGAVPPLMLRTPANPGGLPMEVFDAIRAGRWPTARSSSSTSRCRSTASTAPGRRSRKASASPSGCRA